MSNDSWDITMDELQMIHSALHGKIKSLADELCRQAYSESLCAELQDYCEALAKYSNLLKRFRQNIYNKSK